MIPVLQELLSGNMHGEGSSKNHSVAGDEDRNVGINLERESASKAHPLQKAQRMGHPDFVEPSKGGPPDRQRSAR